VCRKYSDVCSSKTRKLRNFRWHPISTRSSWKKICWSTFTATVSGVATDISCWQTIPKALLCLKNTRIYLLERLETCRRWAGSKAACNITSNQIITIFFLRKTRRNRLGLFTSTEPSFVPQTRRLSGKRAVHRILCAAESHGRAVRWTFVVAILQHGHCWTGRIFGPRIFRPQRKGSKGVWAGVRQCPRHTRVSRQCYSVGSARQVDPRTSVHGFRCVRFGK